MFRVSALLFLIFGAVFLFTNQVQAAPGDLIINEIMWGGSSTSTADEWIELKNTSTSAIDLNGWKIDNLVGASTTLVLNSAICPATTTIPVGGFLLIANATSMFGQISDAVNVGCATTTVDLLDNYNQNGALLLRTPGGATIDLTPSSTVVWPAGSTTTLSSMARDYVAGDGSVATNWHTSIISRNWDAGAAEKGTPGASNGYAVSGSFSQLNGSATGTVYVNILNHGSQAQLATYSQNATGTYEFHMFGSNPADNPYGATTTYDFLAFRDSDATFTQYNIGAEPVQTLNNSGAGFNSTSGLANVNFTLAVNPVITGLSPSFGYVSSTITILGSYFGGSTTTAQGKVYIPPYIDAGNRIITWSATSIVVNIPQASQDPTTNPQTGVLQVEVGWTPRATTTLTIKPKITAAAATTKSVSITFDSFMDGAGGASNASNYTLQTPIGTAASLAGAWVDFRGNKVYIKNISLTQGNTFKIIANSNVKSIPGTAVDASFSSTTGTVAASPSITSVTPNSATSGVSVTIAGTSFGASAGSVYFSPGMPTPGSPPPQPILATTSSWGNTSITATVPDTAKSGPIFVVTSEGVESDFSQSAFVNILGSANFKVQEANTNNIIASSSARIIIAGMGGPQVYYTGDGVTTYSGGTTTVPNVSSMGFTWAFDNSGNHVSARGQQLNTATTTVFSLATSTTKISGVITNANANRMLVVFADPVEGTGQGMEFKEPIFITTNANGTTSYSVGLSATGTYMIGVEDPGFGGTASSSAKIAPGRQQVNASTTTAVSGINFAFTSATARIRGKIEKAGGTGFDVGPGMEAFHVWAYQPITNGLNASAMPNSNGYFDLYVNPGIYIVGLGGPDLPSPIEKQVEVKEGDTNFGLGDSTTDIVMIIKAPEEYISGRVTDSSGNAISGASVFSWNASGPGGGQAFTDSSGYYKLYVGPGTYTVEGFAPEYGKLSTRTGVQVSDDCHTGSSCPTVDFGVSSDMATVSGTVNKNSTAANDIEIWLTQGEKGYGMNRTRTGSDGTFSLRVPYGSGYWIHAAAPGKGEIYRAALTTLSSSVSTTSVAISLNTATINVRISPSSAFSQAFVEARNTDTGQERGFSDKDSSTDSGYRQYSIEVARPAAGSWTYFIAGGIPGFGPITPTTTSIASDTTSATINITLGSVYTVSGSISDPDASNTGNQAEGAFVWASSASGHGGGVVDSSGNFSFTLKGGTYDFGINKDNYSGNMLNNQTISASTTVSGLALTSAGLPITGTVSIGGTAESGAWVWAQNGSGGWSGDETDGNGTYILKVTSGTWQVQAVSEGYQSAKQSVEVTSGTTTLNISLTAVSGYTSATPTVSSITPKTGGTIQGDNVTVDAPSGALSSSDSNTGRMSIQKTTSVPETNSVKPLGGSAFDITATNASGTPFTNLNDNITITLTYTASDLALAGITQASSTSLSLGYWDSTANTWTTISTNVATTSDGGAIFTGTTNHLSPYAPLVSSGASPPSTPAGLSATAGNGHITLNWTASAGAALYNVYKKSGDLYPFLASTTAVTYTNSGLTNGTTYYYKVSAENSDGDESTSTDAVSGTPAAPQTTGTGGSSAGGGAYTPPASSVPTTVTGQVTATGGEGGKTTLITTENSKASAELPSSAVSANTGITITSLAKSGTDVSSAALAVPSGKSIVGSYVFNYTATTASGTVTAFNKPVTLTFTYADSQVSGLNESTLKVNYWDASNSIWVVLPSVVNTAANTVTATTTHFTYFAVLGETSTTTVVKETVTVKPISQMTIEEMKAEIVKLTALILQLQQELLNMTGVSSISGIPSGFAFKTTLKYKMVSGDVKYLQIILNSDPATKIASEGPGSPGKETNIFGDLTKAAVIKFQEKYASEVLTPLGLSKGTGVIGSATIAKLNKLLGK